MDRLQKIPCSEVKSLDRNPQKYTTPRPFTSIRFHSLLRQNGSPKYQTSLRNSRLRSKKQGIVFCLLFIVISRVVRGIPPTTSFRSRVQKEPNRWFRYTPVGRTFDFFSYQGKGLPTTLLKYSIKSSLGPSEGRGDVRSSVIFLCRRDQIRGTTDQTTTGSTLRPLSDRTSLNSETDTWDQRGVYTRFQIRVIPGIFQNNI